MPFKGSFTQGLVVLLTKPVSLECLSRELQNFGVAKTLEPSGEWAFGGPTVVIPFRPEVNGFVAVDVVDHPWPDEMGNVETESVVLGAWSMGHFGPFAYPGNLERAMQQAWHWSERTDSMARHRALIRIRSSYVLGAEPSSPIFPPKYDPCEELIFVTRVARQLLDLPTAVCYFNPNGEMLRTREELDGLMQRHEEEGLIPQEAWVNVRFFKLEGCEPWMLMDTVGMWQLDVPDHEAAFEHGRYDASDVARFLRNAADYVFQNGQIIKDGDTMDGPNSTRWQAATFETPVADPPREVLRWLPVDSSNPPRKLTQGEPEGDFPAEPGK